MGDVRELVLSVLTGDQPPPFVRANGGGGVSNETTTTEGLGR